MPRCPVLSPFLLRSLPWLALLGLLACGPATRTPEVEEPTLSSSEAANLVAEAQPLPTVDLTTADEGARSQLEAARARAGSLLAEATTSPAEQAAALGDLGLLYTTYELLDAAEICFAKARALEPESFRWHYLLAYLDGLQGRLDEALTLYRRTLELAPDYLPAVLRLGRAQLEQGDPEAARQSFERALALDPRSAPALAGLGKVAAALGDDATAIERFEQALAEAPEASGLHYALAQAQRNRGNLERARYHLERSGDVAPRIDDPLINPLASIAESAQFYLVQGAEAIDDRDFAAAAAAFRAALDKAPGDFTAHQGLAMALERLGDVEGAVAAWRGALDHAHHDDPERDRRQRASALRALGLLAASEGQEEAALADYRQSLELVPEQPDLLLRTANALARQRRFDEAIAGYDQLVALRPEWRPAVLEKRATALLNLGRRDEALAAFEAAITAAPGDARLRLRQAAALDYVGSEEAAETARAVAQTLADEPDERALLYADEAHRALASNDLERALENYAAALAETPDNSELRFAHASLLGHLARFDEAVAELERVLAAAPRHEPAHRQRVIALLLGERWGAARVALQEALRTFPRHAAFALTQVRLLASAPDPAVRDGALALAIAQRLAAERRDPPTAEALALALAEAGRPAEAVVLTRRLVQEAEHAGSPRATALRARLALFELGRAWTARSPEDIFEPLIEGGQSRRAQP